MTTPSAPSRFQFVAPPPAAVLAAGYTSCTLGPDVTLGTNWFLFNLLGKTPITTPPQAVQQPDGTIHLPGADGSGFGANICTAHKVGTQWAGLAVGGGYYVEATLAFTPAVSPPGPAFPYPCFWADEINYLAQVGGTSEWIELDCLEQVPLAAPYISRAGCIHWYGSPAVAHNTPTPNSLVRAPADMTQPHRYGTWVQPGSIQNFCDGVPISYLAAPPTVWPVSAGVDVSLIDRSHLALIIGSVANCPMTVYAASAWQRSAAGNLTGN